MKNTKKKKLNSCTRKGVSPTPTIPPDCQSTLDTERMQPRTNSNDDAINFLFDDDPFDLFFDIDDDLPF
ncbi:hypothetical protein ACFLR8_01545 [Bacteroidota bacterium]